MLRLGIQNSIEPCKQQFCLTAKLFLDPILVRFLEGFLWITAPNMACHQSSPLIAN
jgi:hypothetical protein